jgi:excisionase family DNA binding protein
MKLADATATLDRLPSDEDRTIARETSRLLAPLLKQQRSLSMSIHDARGKTETATLPPMAVRLLVDLLSEMAKGNTVTLIPVHAELTTQEAANLLNVSRPFVVSLIKAKKLVARKVGTHRRIRFADLQAYKASIDTERAAALDALAQQAQELNMGY